VATSDPVGTALASIAAGATSGAAVLTAGVLALRILQSGEPSALSPDVGGLILSTAVSVALLVAVTVTWLRSRPVADIRRRGVAAAVAVFGMVILAAFAPLADTLGGTVGLGVSLALFVAAAFAAHRAARRAGAA
jgi:uncharacterized membrane protein (DUF441 family)